MYKIKLTKIKEYLSIFLKYKSTYYTLKIQKLEGILKYSNKIQ